MDVNLPSRTEHCFQQMAGRPEYYIFCQHPGQIPGHFQASWLSSRFPAVSDFLNSKENRGEYHRRRPGPAERNDQTCYNKNTISGTVQQDGPVCKAKMPACKNRPARCKEEPEIRLFLTV
jgi:hypothetical protein